MTILDTVVARAPLGEHDGRSGASLERVRLADGTRLVVKRASGEMPARELALWQGGALDGLAHCIVDAGRRVTRS